MSSEKSSTASVEELYLKEKKKASILMVSTIALAVLLIGSIATRPDANSSEPVALQNTQANTGQRGAGGRGGQPITGFFDESGAVDQEAITALTDRIPGGGDPSQFLERFTLQIDAAVESGEITEIQGTELKAAFSQIETSEI